jgi:HAMP domain-containing protein
MHRRFNRSLSVDLTLGLVVTLILIEGLLLLFLYQRQSRIMQEEIEFKADDYALKLSEVLAVPMWDFDDKQIEKIGKGFLQNELVRQLRITNNQGNQILVLENPGDEGPLIKRAVDIQYNAQTIGHAEIVLSAAFYFQELVLLRNVLLTVLFASALVFFLASGLLLRLLLRKPLRVLAQGMDRIARGEFDHRSENLSYTELTGIAERFSQMAEQIKGREKALTDINKELHAVNTQVRRRIQYEQMLAELSAQAASAKDFSRFAENSLQLMGATFGFAWVGFYRSRSDDTHLSIVSEWPPRQQAKGPADLQMTGEGFGAELMDALRDRRTIMFIDPQLPDSAVNAQTDIQNLLAFPIEVQQQLYGGILFGGDSETSDWEDIRPLLETRRVSGNWPICCPRRYLKWIGADI